jgi:hypothetical protein
MIFNVYCDSFTLSENSDNNLVARVIKEFFEFSLQSQVIWGEMAMVPVSAHLLLLICVYLYYHADLLENLHTLDDSEIGNILSYHISIYSQ